MADQASRVRSAAERWLHGAAAVVSLAVAAWVLYLVNPPTWSDAYVSRYMAGIEHHKTFGLLALALGGLWLALRRPLSRPPSSPGERQFVSLVHAGLALSLLVLPVSGYLSSTLYGNALLLGGAWRIPPLLPENKNWAGLFHAVHKYGGYAFLALAGVHTAGALVHVRRRDGVWAGMWPFGGAGR